MDFDGAALHNPTLRIFGQRRKNAEHPFAVGRGGIDLRSGAGQDFQPDAVSAQLVDGVHQVLEIAAQPVELQTTSVLPGWRPSNKQPAPAGHPCGRMRDPGTPAS